MLFLLQGHRRLFLRQKCGVIAFVAGQAVALHLPDAGAHFIQKIAVVADHQHCAGVAFQIIFQPFHGDEVQVIGGLVQNQDIRPLEQQPRKAQPGVLTAGEHRHALLIGLRPEAHAAEHLFDIHIHVVAVGSVDDRRELGVLRQDLLVVGVLFQLFLQQMHAVHRFQHRRKGIAHLAVNVLLRVQLAVLFQIPKGHAPGQLHFPLVGLILAAEDLEQSGLAGAVFTHDADAFSLLHRGVDALKDHHFAKAFSDVL